MLVVTACQASHLSSGHSTPCWRRPLHVTTPKTRWNGFDALRHEINVADSTHRFSQFQQDASSENREVGQGDGMLWPLRSQRNGGSRERASIESRHRNALSHPVTLALTLVAPGPLWSLSAVRKRKKSMYNGTFHTTQIDQGGTQASRACKYSAPANAAACSHHESCFERGHVSCVATLYEAREEFAQTMLHQQQLVK